MMPLHMNSFRQFDFLNLQEHQLSPEESKIQPIDHSQDSKIIYQRTCECQPESFEELIIPSFKKTEFRDYDISFEASFMKEHENAFRKQTENFIESCFKIHENRSSELPLTQLLGTLLRQSSTDQDSFAQLFQQEDKFLRIIKNQQKIGSFVKYLQTNSPKSIFQQYLYLIYLSRKQFQSMKQTLYSVQDILTACENLSQQKFQSIFKDERFKFLKMDAKPATQLNSKFIIEDSLKNYIKFLFSTIYLISLEYFENPFITDGLRSRSVSFSNVSQIERLQQGNNGLPQKRKNY